MVAESAADAADAAATAASEAKGVKVGDLLPRFFVQDDKTVASLEQDGRRLGMAASNAASANSADAPRNR